MKKHIGIIGGGAAGMMAAVTAARKGTKVTILERNDRIGKKILQTGNGKCNLGNKNLTVECYHGGDAAWIKQALERFGTEDTVCFFQKIGLLIKEKNGYLYPVSEQAAYWMCFATNCRRWELKSSMDVKCRKWNEHYPGNLW